MNNELMSRLKLLSEQAKKLADDPPGNIKIKMMNSLCDYMGELFPVKIIEELLEIYKKKYESIIKQKIPDLMIENEIADITLENGTHISIKKNIYPEVVSRERMIDWLEKIGEGDSIKTKMTFPKGEVKNDLVEYLEAEGYSFEMCQNVEWQSLKKIIRDRMDSGESFPPEDAVQVGVWDEAKIS